MKKCSQRKMLQIFLVTVVGYLGSANASGIESEADRILRAMSEYLKTATEFRFHTNVAYDELLSTGEMIQFGGSADISVRRPARLHVKFDGDERSNWIVYDGSTITYYDAQENLYAAAPVPPDIDGAMDTVFEKYGLSVPIADLVYSDPYSVLTAEVETGTVIGMHACGDRRCHHLAFTQEFIDWQIWIEQGPRPVVRKLLIIYKDEPGSPHYETRISGWDFAPRLSDHYFQFYPPAGADAIEFLSQGESE